ncbi:MAG: TniQ family protein [Thalassospira sp.]|uniref:TniQ family protein n=1 Tax=Thalassospira sp. TaxID=1912094 RepID=UPI001B03337C|nr:helix-turn-helix domain-containing protein [Thalassospira sp.]MBO6577546.1 TniQ family protein [Thalassospira sp.]MBO6818069.1 TniQ family protein [Thalassospira sp.]MBO6886704.1 TniQ family protein [Thalassospira sp.]
MSGDLSLLVRPKPEKAESFRGYLLRVSTENGYHNPNWMLRQLGIHPRTYLPRDDIAKLASALNLGDRELSNIQSRIVGPRWVRVGAHEVHICAQERRSFRYCPQCLSEAPYHRALWDIKPLSACPKHGTYLLENCRKCNRRVGWARENHLECACGADLRSFRPRSAPDKTIDFCRLLEKRFHGQRAEENCALHPAFQMLSFTDLLNHTMFLAAYISGRGRGTGRQLFYNLTADALREVFDRVSVVLSDWPNGFHLLLDEVRQFTEQDVEKHVGLEAEFRSLYTNLFRKQQEVEHLHLIRAEFAKYIEGKWFAGFVVPTSKRLSDDWSQDQSFVTVAEAARRLGIHPSILRRDIAEGSLAATTRQMQSRCLRVIEVAEVERYRNARENLLGTYDAQELLGVSKHPFMKLVNAGLIRAVKGPKVDGSQHWAFKKQDIEEFIASVTKQATYCRFADEPVTFGKALRRCTAKGLCIVDLIQGVLGGELKSQKRSTKVSNLKDLFFNDADFRAFLYNEKRTIKWAVTIREASRMLGLNEEATRHLVHKGFLETTSVPVDGRLRRQVSLDAIERFKATYVSASCLAAHKNTSARSVVAELQELGTSPVTGPAIDGSRQYFFRRSATG